MFVSTAGIIARPTATAGSFFVLDNYPGAASAYSTSRRLSSAYTGALFRVRRSSDNTEQDIGYTAGNVLNETALTTFVGAGNGFITRWYDQSGNARNTTLESASNQPLIVSAGTIVRTTGNIVAMYIGNTASTNISNTQPNTTTQATFLASECATTGNSSTILLPFGVVNSSIYTGAASSGSAISADQNFGVVSYFKNDASITNTRGSIWSAYVTGNETLMNMIGGGTTATGRFTQYPALFANVKLFEVIIYNTNQSANRSGINGNINAFYSIY